MVQKLKTGKYFVQVRIGADRQSYCFDRKSDAEQKESDLKRLQQLIRAGMQAPKESQLVVDFSGQWLRRRAKGGGKAAGTVSQDETRLRLYILPRIGALPLAAVTSAMTRELLDEAQDHPWKFNPLYKREWGPLSNATRNRIRACLHTLFEEAFDRELVVANPVTRVPLEKEEATARPSIPPLSDAEVKKFFAAAFRRGLGDGFLAVVFVFTGGRIGQIAGLQNQDFDLKRNELWFRRIYDPALGAIKEGIKGKPKGIVIPLFPRVRESYIAFRRGGGPKGKTAFLFAQENGEAMSTWTLRRRIDSIRGDAKIRHITPHVLRATFATLGEEAGFSKEDLQALLGHSSVLVTQRYTRRSAAPLLEKGERIGFGGTEDSEE